MGWGLRTRLEHLAARHLWIRRGLLYGQLRLGGLLAGRHRHPIDRQYGIDTQTRVPLYMNRTGSAVDDYIIPYGGCVAGALRHVLDGLPKGPNWSFIDLGCGKGRALVVASEYPFGAILGVELNAGIAAVARSNARRIARLCPARTPIKIEVGDASLPILPGGDLIVFLYHPFGGVLVERLALTLAAAATDRTVLLVYENPVHGAVFDRHPRFQRQGATMLPSGPELAFSFDAEEAFAIWRIGPGMEAPSALRHPIRIIKPEFRAVIDMEEADARSAPRWPVDHPLR